MPFSVFCRRCQQWCLVWVIEKVNAHVTSAFMRLNAAQKSCREAHDQLWKAVQCRSKALVPESEGPGLNPNPATPYWVMGLIEQQLLNKGTWKWLST